MNTLWENIIAGDKDAYSTAYLEFYRRFYSYGLKFSPEVALVEDVIQETLLFIWFERKRFAGIVNPEGYCFSVFRNNLFRKIKDHTKRLSIEGRQEADPEFSRDCLLIEQETEKELCQTLKAAIEGLSSRQREIIFLRFYEGLSYEQIAFTMDITIKATYKLAGRALLKLKEKLL